MSMIKFQAQTAYFSKRYNTRKKRNLVVLLPSVYVAVERSRMRMVTLSDNTIKTEDCAAMVALKTRKNPNHCPLLCTWSNNSGFI